MAYWTQQEQQHQDPIAQAHQGLKLYNTIKNWNDAPAKPIVGSEGGAPIGGGLAEGAGAAAGAGEAAGAAGAGAAGGLAELAPLLALA